nr:hypothetical protein [uncultured Holophaga sp.]
MPIPMPVLLLLGAPQPSQAALCGQGAVWTEGEVRSPQDLERGETLVFNGPGQRRLLVPRTPPEGRLGLGFGLPVRS